MRMKIELFTLSLRLDRSEKVVSFTYSGSGNRNRKVSHVGRRQKLCELTLDDL